MNSDTFKGKWLQVRGNIQKQWGKLTNDDLDQVDGNLDVLLGKIQERYGKKREEVEKELDRVCENQKERLA
jgi:uncharacterized protein YjbJ (UPF0337 family)